MILRIVNHLKEHGVARTSWVALAAVFSMIGLEIRRSDTTYFQWRKSNKLFTQRSLRNSDSGYWFLTPKLLDSELENYYQQTYWNNRGGKDFGCSVRDLVHFKILTECIGEFLAVPRTILNFGAGHGGISNLFWANKHHLVNVEPSGLPIGYSTRWDTRDSIKEVLSNEVDLVYGSHSLEHVADVGRFLEEVKRILKPNGYVFWEVPNGNHHVNGAIVGKIVAPHTYYFRKEFFDNNFGTVIVNSTFNPITEEGFIDDWRKSEAENGVVIRFLGQF